MQSFIMRAVVDTSVLVSALLTKEGSSRELIRLCLMKKIEPFVGEALFFEYESLFKRRDLFVKCPISFQDRQILFNAFLSVCQWLKIYFNWRPNLKDEADNHVMELAVAASADVIITKNKKDFKNSELKFPEIRILNPQEFLKEFVWLQ